MNSKLKNKRKKRIALQDIDLYCQSVENLLVTINDSHRGKKRIKIEEAPEEYLPPDDHSWPFSDN
ncbi:MAG: hypothetical protein AMK71_11020 [Nitrospira bacterium SG8_35_4]|nr:MAG: hypothetical protein AMK71_11020 [Nitrospira bacterium SG8_35_4]